MGARWTRDDLEYLRRGNGELTYAEMGKALGRTEPAVAGMMEKLGLRERRNRVDEDRLRELNGLGYADFEIAKALGNDWTTIKKHRERLGLPSHRFGERHREKLSAWGKDLQSRGARPSIREALATASRRFAVESGWPEDLGARQVQILNTLAAVGLPMTKGEISKAVGISIHALDVNHLGRLARRGLLACLPRSRQGKRKRLNTYSLGIVALGLLEEWAKCRSATGK